MQIKFRPIESDDYDFLWQLHNAALKNYIDKTWGWDENWQQRNFKKVFNINDGKIIVFDKIDIGFLWSIEKADGITLASIRILPEYQNKGIGTKIIKDLIASSNKKVRLQVLKVNPARIFYERLGFVIKDETDTHFVMEKKSAD